jgi:hypothetical protein
MAGTKMLHGSIRLDDARLPTLAIAHGAQRETGETWSVTCRTIGTTPQGFILLGAAPLRTLLIAHVAHKDTVEAPSALRRTTATVMQRSTLLDGARPRTLLTALEARKETVSGRFRTTARCPRSCLMRIIRTPCPSDGGRHLFLVLLLSGKWRGATAHSQLDVQSQCLVPGTSQTGTTVRRPRNWLWTAMSLPSLFQRF